MDWPTFFKDYPTVVNALVGLMGIAIGFIANGLLNRAKRKWELDDREYSRRATVYDMRIKEVRDFIDRLDAWVDMMRNFTFKTLYYLLSEKDRNDRIEVLMESLNPVINKLSNLNEGNIGKKSSIDVLNDNELLDLYEEFQPFVLPNAKKIWIILDKIKVDDTSDMSAVDDLKTLSKDVEDADSLVKKMKVRLDGLAQKVP